MAGARVRKWLAISVAVAGVAIAGCSKDDPTTAFSDVAQTPEGIAQCKDVYKADAPVDPKTFGTACVQGDNMVVPRAVKLRCTDNKYLYSNKFAWGYEKGPMTLLDEETSSALDTPAYNESLKCLKTTASGAQRTTLPSQS